MKDKDAIKFLNGHGRVVCSVCGKVLITCKCMNCDKNIIYVTCEECDDK